MPGKVWKSKVDHLGASIDRCRERIDEIVQEEKGNVRFNKMSKLSEQYTQQIYNNGSGTTVEVSIKTKKPSSKQPIEYHKSPAKLQIENSKDMNWDTLLSQDDRSDIFSINKDKKQLPLKSKSKNSMISKNSDRSKRVKSVRHKNGQDLIESKRFASKTKSSISKEKELGEDARRITRNAKSATSYVASDDKYLKETISNDFTNRTLQIFLRELRVAVNSSSSNTNRSANCVDLNKIIDDIEYVASNLNPSSIKASDKTVLASLPVQPNKPADSAIGLQTKLISDSQSPTHLMQAQIVRQLQLEVEKHIVENKKMETKIEKIRSQLKQKELLIQERDDKLDDMKTIVGRLTGTNNELLAILSTKVRLEESLKSLESANRKLIQELEIEKRRNSDLHTNNLQKNQEIGHLQKVLNDLRGSMAHHVKDVENVIDDNLAISKVGKRKNDNKVVANVAEDSTFATVDLGLSSDHSSNGNSPLPTDPPAKSSKEVEDYERILPFDTISASNLFDQGTLKESEQNDDDRDSAIGNSESYSLMPGISSKKKTEMKGKFVSPRNVPSNSSYDQMIQSEQTPKVSLGEQIKVLHQVSEDQKKNQQTILRESQEQVNHNYKPHLSLSETVDSERLEATTNAKDRLNDVSSKDNSKLKEDKNTKNAQKQTNQIGPRHSAIAQEDKISISDLGAGDRLMSKQNLIANQPTSLKVGSSEEMKMLTLDRTDIDKRKSKEEIERLKMHREQQNRILEQQRSKEIENQKAEEQKIANQIKAASQNVHERVNDFLLRMKNDDKFQVSLSSRADFDVDRVPYQPSTMQMNFTGTTNPGEEGVHSPSLTESRFRQGLEDSLEYSAVSDT